MKDIIRFHLLENKLNNEFKSQRITIESRAVYLGDPIKRNKLNFTADANIKIKEAGIFKHWSQ